MTNILIVPLIPLAMLLTFMSGIASAVWLWLAQLIALPTTWLLSYMTYVATLFAGQPWAVIEMHVGAVFVALYYAAVVGISWYLWRRTRYDFRQANIVE